MDESGDVLMIEIGKGRAEIVGPKVGALHRDICKGKATLIRSDGLDIIRRLVVP